MTSDQLSENIKIRSFRDLEIWQEAHSLVVEIYRITKNFPKEEIYGLNSQIRRSASSVAACIVEGHSRNTTKEFIKFLYDARASAAETEYHLLLSKDLNYLSVEICENFSSRYQILGRRINALINSLDKTGHR
ncbi:four helix bundle protein [Candidatus Microgenomates bacterium]|nr:MAG: four helix bundle protein [Candidatus Microgenomates bacterium]